MNARWNEYECPATSAPAACCSSAAAAADAAVRAAGADEVIDYTTTDVLSAVGEQVDVLINLAPIEPEQFAALVAVVRDGGKVVSTTAVLATPSDEARGVTAATVFVLPNRERLTELVSLVDKGELQVEVTRRIPLTELPALHAEAAAARIKGKVIIQPA